MLDDKLSALKAQARIRGEELEVMPGNMTNNLLVLPNYVMPIQISQLFY